MSTKTVSADQQKIEELLQKVAEIGNGYTSRSVTFNSNAEGTPSIGVDYVQEIILVTTPGNESNYIIWVNRVGDSKIGLIREIDAKETPTAQQVFSNLGDALRTFAVRINDNFADTEIKLPIAESQPEPLPQSGVPVADLINSPDTPNPTPAPAPLPQLTPEQLQAAPVTEVQAGS